MKVPIAFVYLTHLALVRGLAVTVSFVNFQVPKAFPALGII